MDFVEVPGAAHHVPLDKPLEIVAIITVSYTHLTLPTVLLV